MSRNHSVDASRLLNQDCPRTMKKEGWGEIWGRDRPWTVTGLWVIMVHWTVETILMMINQ